MIQVINLEKTFYGKTLFKDVNLKLLAKNTYGVIGANGAGKSTFLKLLSKQEEVTHGEIIIEKNKRISILEQDQFKYDNLVITDIVIMGHYKLYEIMERKNKIYEKPDFSNEDGEIAAQLEEEFAELGGWEAESDAEKLLGNLGIDKVKWNFKMSELKSSEKVKVLLAKAIFGNPDILILDEPTNHLDLQAIAWLEEFMINYKNTIIVVSHDSDFLDNVCTHIIDIDRMNAKLYVGNYSFWKESSTLMLELQKQSNLKKEEKIEKLKTFIARFQANASKSSQATSRKKSLEKIEIESIQPSTRKYPYIRFEINRDLGKKVLIANNLSYTNDDNDSLFNNVTFRLEKGDKLAILGKDDISKRKFLEILVGIIKPIAGDLEIGESITIDYFPSDNSKYFDSNETILDWIMRQTNNSDDKIVRSYLGRMLFSGDDVLKKVSATSGGEKVRLMFTKMMLTKSNFLIFDQPLDHLDTESIFSTIEALSLYKGNVIFTTYNKTLISKCANSIMDLDLKEPFLFRGTINEYLNKA